METLLYLIWEFLKIGLFSIGGGLATIPFLVELTQKTDWFTMEQLTEMIAISESTPGPVGLNMATFGGYHAAGIVGGIVASLALVIPSIVIIIIIAKFLENFSENKFVKWVFWGIRPAVAGLIAAVVFKLFQLTLFITKPSGLQPDWYLIGFAVLLFLVMQIKFTKKWHPAIWIAVAAVVGMVFQL